MKAFINGNIYTMNEKSMNVDYMLVEDSVIREIGNNYSGNKDVTEVIDLKSKTVVPGFTDSHLHMLSYAEKKERQVDLSGVRSKRELINVTKEYIKEKGIKEGQWVIGVGWNHELFDECEIPDKNVLDEISKEHPIVLIRACYHIGVVNSRSLEIAGITKSLIDVQGGQIDRNESGEPTGVLRENALELVEKMIPGIDDKQTMKDLLVLGLKDAAGVGLTTVCIDDFSYVSNKEALLKAYRELNEEEKLPINIVLQLRAASVEDIYMYKKMGLRSWQREGMITIGPIKIIGDGSLGSCTAALNQPYEGNEDNKGILLLNQKKMDEMVRVCFENDFDIAVHSIGDRAMQTVLNSYEKYEKIYKEKNLCPSIIHCQIASEDIINQMARLNVIANIQPIFLCTDWSIVESRVGKGRENYSYCWKTMIDKGVLCVGGSDAPIESFNPLYGLYAAMSRSDMKSKPEGGWHAKEKLSLIDAMKMFTVNTAYQTHELDCRGSIEEGKNADFVILDGDINDLQKRYDGCKVYKTYVRGKLV